MASFLPYGRQLIEDDDVAAVTAALRSDFLTTGPAIDAFEQKLCEAVGATYAVAVANGTAALHAACFAAGLSDGDEALVPAVTFLATANAVRYCGAVGAEGSQMVRFCCDRTKGQSVEKRGVVSRLLMRCGIGV